MICETISITFEEYSESHGVNSSAYGEFSESPREYSNASGVFSESSGEYSNDYWSVLQNSWRILQ
jgi:hypothetical protein